MMAELRLRTASGSTPKLPISRTSLVPLPEQNARSYGALDAPSWLVPDPRRKIAQVG